MKNKFAQNKAKALTKAKKAQKRIPVFANWTTEQMLMLYGDNRQQLQRKRRNTEKKLASGQKLGLQERCLIPHTPKQHTTFL